MAEGKGFEPPEGVSSFNDLANRRLQPLGHPSAIMGIWGCPQHGVCNIHLTKDDGFVKPWIA
jgi:hypothetical protein